VTGAELVKAFMDRGVTLTADKSERGISITHGVRVSEVDVPVKRKSGGTVIEKHQVEVPWYSLFARGDLLAHFNENDAVSPSLIEEAERGAQPLPHEAMHPLSKTSFTAIGLVGMTDSENALQLAKVQIADGKVVSIEPLFDCERERDSFAFARLESTLVGWTAGAYEAGDFRGPK
jgi:hypothetical protein